MLDARFRGHDEFTVTGDFFSNLLDMIPSKKQQQKRKSSLARDLLLLLLHYSRFILKGEGRERREKMPR
jgi:hypothetical protein